MDDKIRIKDIAEQSGVSVGTVDRVLHNRPNVSKQAREKVEAVLKRIDDFARRIDGGEVQIHQEVRPELVGGFIFRIGDLMIDASISTQIARLKRAFSQTTNRIV